MGQLHAFLLLFSSFLNNFETKTKKMEIITFMINQFPPFCASRPTVSPLAFYIYVHLEHVVPFCNRRGAVSCFCYSIHSALGCLRTQLSGHAQCVTFKRNGSFVMSYIYSYVLDKNTHCKKLSEF